MISIVLKLLSKFRCRDYKSSCCSDDNRTIIVHCPHCESKLKLTSLSFTKDSKEYALHYQSDSRQKREAEVLSSPK